jgi:CHASE3 domain sensor protein/putative methionine-R-sulfoxide reductase with GAF domain
MIRNVTAWLKKNTLYLAIFLILFLMLVTSFFAFRNQQILKETERLSKESDRVIVKTNDLVRYLNQLDLGLRGYALTKDEKSLDLFTFAVAHHPRELDSIRTFMTKHEAPTDNLEKYGQAFTDYVAFSRQMVELATIDSMSLFQDLLRENRGLSVLKAHHEFSAELIAHETSLKKQAEDRYASALNSGIVIQILLLLIGGPCLFLIYYRIRRQEAHQKALLINLEKNNRQFVFDPGTPLAEDAAEILDSSIRNIKDASDFIKKITTGNFGVTWPGMTKENTPLNKENLSGTLMDMRDQMKRIQDEDRTRIWTTEGLTKFTEIIRQHQDDAKTLADQASRFLVRYMNAQQGAVFVLQEDLEENEYLELSACYAFDKRKFVEKKIDIGQGMIGQVFLEGSTVVLKDVPSGYTHITSGLGEATPTCVLIVPMKYNEKTEGVFEIAGFEEWEEYQRSFIEKATEYMAAALSAVRSTQKTKTLLEQMQSQTQQLHAQEEEMRQNMEELAATNEEMKRKESEYLKNHA